jgi:hypothetical protein
VKASRPDPFVVVVVVLGALVIAGLVGVAVAWRGVAATLVVALQMPYAVSGGLGGLALVGFALGVASVQASRRAAAQERADFGRVVDAAADLLAAVRSDAVR